MNFSTDKNNRTTVAGDYFKIRNNDRGIEFEIKDDSLTTPKITSIEPLVYSVLDREADFGVWLKNLPFCAINESSRDHILPRGKSYRGEKIEKCKVCRFFKECSGFPTNYFKKYGRKEVRPIKDLPVEVMIEIDPRCNFNCRFCFNSLSFAGPGRNIKLFSKEYVKKIIDSVNLSGIKIIRFTGGEPMLREDIFELLRYAKEKKLETRLNTNGSLLSKKAVNKLTGIIDNVLIPIESYSRKKEEKLCGFKGSLDKKIKAVRLLKKIGVPVVRVGSVIDHDNISNFDKLAKLVLNLPIDEWEFYRPISLDEKNRLDRKNLEILVNKISELRGKTDKKIIIANGIPFCAIKDKNKINAISAGSLFDDGHNRLVVDPRGFIKPHYFIDENLGSPLKILNAWRHPFMKKMRSLYYLPKICRGCHFKYKCRGGSRYLARLSFGQWNAPDPLMPG